MGEGDKGEGEKEQPPREEKIWKPTDPGTPISPPPDLPSEGDTSGGQSQEEPPSQPSREKSDEHFGPPDEAIWQAEKDDARTDPPSLPDTPG